MIEFKRNIKKALPYDRQQYLNFLDGEFDSFTKWFGVSFQLADRYEGKKISLKEYIKAYNGWFKSIITELDNDSFWIVNHDDKDLQWFPNDEENLIPLRTLFKENNISNKFKGALLFTKGDLLKLSTVLISYPLAVFDKEELLYKNLDISHNKLPFIIKMSGHGNIDLLSKDKNLLAEVIAVNVTDNFILKPYSGTF